MHANVLVKKNAVGIMFIPLLAFGWFGVIRFNRYLGGILGQIDSTMWALLQFLYVFLCLNLILFKFCHSLRSKILVTILFGVSFSILMLLDFWGQEALQDDR